MRNAIYLATLLLSLSSFAKESKPAKNEKAREPANFEAKISERYVGKKLFDTFLLDINCMNYIGSEGRSYPSCYWKSVSFEGDTGLCDISHDSGNLQAVQAEPPESIEFNDGVYKVSDGSGLLDLSISEERITGKFGAMKVDLVPATEEGSLDLSRCKKFRYTSKGL